MPRPRNKDDLLKAANEQYAWVNTDLGSYFVSVMPSHYDWAMKKLKAHRKNCGEIAKR